MKHQMKAIEHYIRGSQFWACGYNFDALCWIRNVSCEPKTSHGTTDYPKQNGYTFWICVGMQSFRVITQMEATWAQLLESRLALTLG